MKKGEISNDKDGILQLQIRWGDVETCGSCNEIVNNIISIETDIALINVTEAIFSLPDKHIL